MLCVFRQAKDKPNGQESEHSSQLLTLPSLICLIFRYISCIWTCHMSVSFRVSACLTSPYSNPTPASRFAVAFFARVSLPAPFAPVPWLYAHPQIRALPSVQRHVYTSSGTSVADDDSRWPLLLVSKRGLRKLRFHLSPTLSCSNTKPNTDREGSIVGERYRCSGDGEDDGCTKSVHWHQTTIKAA